MEDEQFGARRMNRSFLAQLPREVQRWQAQGLITFDQGHAILNGYHFPEAVPDSRNRLVTVLVILGAVLLGLGVILFFAANWQAFPKGFKLGLMLVGVPAIYGLVTGCVTTATIYGSARPSSCWAPSSLARRCIWSPRPTTFRSTARTSSSIGSWESCPSPT